VTTTIGIISDTHGLMRPEAIEALRGVDRIVHAGDVGSPEVLEALAEVSPVTAVRGNIDKGAWAKALPESEVLEIGSVSLYVLHEIGQLDLDPVAADFQAVIAGHSHNPSVETRNGVIYLNPGSAGPRRFKLPVALARLKISGNQITTEVVRLPSKERDSRRSLGSTRRRGRSARRVDRS